jgi:hypothetical protein
MTGVGGIGVVGVLSIALQTRALGGSMLNYGPTSSSASIFLRSNLLHSCQLSSRWAVRVSGESSRTILLPNAQDHIKRPRLLSSVTVILL